MSLSEKDSEETETFLATSGEAAAGQSRSSRRNKPVTLRQIVMNLGGSVRLNPVGLAVLCGVVLLIIFFSSGSSKAAGPEVSQSSKISLKKLLSVAIAAAEKGGDEVVAVRQEADLGETSKGKTLEGANDPKTNGDMRSHIQMYYGIKKVFPDINVISEEHGEKKPDLSSIPALDKIFNEDVNSRVEEEHEVEMDDVTVWIDPLDATQEYTEKLLQYVTTMVCIAVKGKPTIGVIHKPFAESDKTAWGWAGDVGVVGQAIKVDASNNAPNVKDSSLATARIIVSRSHSGKVNETAQAAFGSGVKVTPAGGAGFKTWEVVKGTQDAYVHTTLIKKWDICSGNAILAALGGKMTTLEGDLIDYSTADKAKNEGGLLATMFNHDRYLEKLKSLQP